MEIINENKEPKKLYRSRNRVIGGVCQGLADYFDIDVVLVRVAAVLLLCAGAGLLAYLIFWIITPQEPVR